MATKNWLDGTADWYTPADWNGGTLPGPTDDIVINTGAPFLQSGDGAAPAILPTAARWMSISTASTAAPA